jgi:hypothetical protein
MTKWEYLQFLHERDKPRMSSTWTGFDYINGKKYSKEEFASYLQKLGENGWELVSAVPIAISSSSWIGMTSDILYTFKRPK